MNSDSKTTEATRNSRPVLVMGVILIATLWIAVFAALAILQPELRIKALILAGGAGLTELILYAGAAWFGISLFQRLRSFARTRRD